MFVGCIVFEDHLDGAPARISRSMTFEAGGWRDFQSSLGQWAQPPLLIDKCLQAPLEDRW